MSLLKYLCRASHDIARGAQVRSGPAVSVGAHPHFASLFIAAISIVTISTACTTTSLSTPDQSPGQSTPKCQVTLTGPQAAIAASGGSGTVAVNAAPECAWSASTQATWLTDLSPASGQGTGNIQFNAAPNPNLAPRQGDIAVSGTLVHVSQDPALCSFQLTPQALSMAFAGGPGSVTVTTAAGCTWSAVSQVNWITITSARDNTGAGTVTINVAAQTDATSRTGSITVAGQTVAVSQASRNCSYSINSSAADSPTAGGTGSVAVTAPTGCTWTATSNAAWITVTAGASGTGAGNVTYTVAANTGAARTGTLLIAGQSFTVKQTSPPCAFGIGPTSQNVNRNSGTGTTVTVTTQSFCSWTAVSNDSWITVSPPTTGLGDGNVGWTYAANQVPVQRTGTMTIAGQTFTVTQAAGCSYTINPTSQSVNRNSGTGTTVAITTQASCTWTAASNDSWITVGSVTSGTGNGNVGWTYAANTTPIQRSGTMTIAGNAFTVTQDPGCSFTITPTSQSVRDAAGAGTTVGVTTQSGCGWTAVSNASMDYPQSAFWNRERQRRLGLRSKHRCAANRHDDDRRPDVYGQSGSAVLIRRGAARSDRWRRRWCRNTGDRHDADWLYLDGCEPRRLD